MSALRDPRAVGRLAAAGGRARGLRRRLVRRGRARHPRAVDVRGAGAALGRRDARSWSSRTSSTPTAAMPTSAASSSVRRRRYRPRSAGSRRPSTPIWRTAPTCSSGVNESRRALPRVHVERDAPLGSGNHSPGPLGRRRGAAGVGDRAATDRLHARRRAVAARGAGGRAGRDPRRLRPSGAAVRPDAPPARPLGARLADRAQGAGDRRPGARVPRPLGRVLGAAAPDRARRRPSTRRSRSTTFG